MDTTRRVYIAILSLVALWCGMVVAAPLLGSISEGTASAIYRFFSRICHQLNERSFHIAGGQFAVCIRCSAIYFAFLIGVVCYGAVRGLANRSTPPLFLLSAASFPMLVDVLLSITGIHASTDATRLATGSLFGFALPWYVLPVFFESLSGISRSSKGEPLYARKAE